MNTYIIDVEKKVVNQVCVNAMSLEEAKQAAIRKSGVKPDASLGMNVEITAICREFRPNLKSA